MIATPPAHLTPTHVGQKIARGKRGYSSALAAAYVGSLDYEARKRYFEKLQNESELLPEPYSLASERWIDDVRRWPSVEFGDLYTFFFFFFQASVHTKQKKNCPENHIIHLGCTAQ